ncbi:MAG: hypothetical protein JSW40_00295 [Candidatus Omnitrophota bacterium]|nr:MAG: hypothetical protein JSW40_00295 [Candidatus Omnitrophota bacterium]
MLKRHQVLLTDWLTEYIKFLAEKYDVSFSEVIRISLSMYFMEMICLLHPKYKFPIAKKEMVRIFNQIAAKRLPEEAKHKLISQLYFEARKAIEFRLVQEKKCKKNKSS